MYILPVQNVPDFFEACLSLDSYWIWFTYLILNTGPVFIPICLNVQRYRNGFSKIYLWGLKDISLPIKSTGFPHNRLYLLNFLKDFTKISFTSFTFTHRMLYINWLPLFNNQISFTFAPISFTFWEITFTFRQISFTLKRMREKTWEVASRMEM